MRDLPDILAAIQGNRPISSGERDYVMSAARHEGWERLAVTAEQVAVTPLKTTRKLLPPLPPRVIRALRIAFIVFTWGLLLAMMVGMELPLDTFAGAAVAISLIAVAAVAAIDLKSDAVPKKPGHRRTSPW